MLPTAHVLYENPDWLPPLVDALEAEGFPVECHFLDEGLLDPAVVPAEGIWLNRVSPSSHTRDHGHTVAMAREVLFWLEQHGRRVINGTHAFELEMSKLRQEVVLRKHGILTPRTVLALGTEQLVRAATTFEGPFITKHNQGGKGLGIHLFADGDQLRAHLASDAFDPGPDGKMILQAYVEAPEPFITRVEIVGGRFLFAMRSLTDEGFQLCPSDACQLPASNPEVCPIDGESDGAASSKFSPSPLTSDDPLVRQLVALCMEEGIEVAGIEFVEDREGRRFVYDINGTTNYSGTLAKQTGVEGMREVARYLREQVAPELAA